MSENKYTNNNGANMPFYEYKCQSGHITEKYESIKSPTVTRCNHQGCDKPAKRIISRIAAVCHSESYPGEHLEKLAPGW